MVGEGIRILVWGFQDLFCADGNDTVPPKTQNSQKVKKIADIKEIEGEMETREVGLAAPNFLSFKLTHWTDSQEQAWGWDCRG